MSRVVTLGTVRSDVAARADVPIAATGGRHNEASVNRLINQSMQRFMVKMSGAGGIGYAKRRHVQTSATQSATLADWSPNEYVSLPSDFFQMLQMQIHDGAQGIFNMQQFPRNESTTFERTFPYHGDINTGMPVYYLVEGGLDDATPTSIATPICQIIPKADQVYDIIQHYVPVHTDLTADTHVFNAIGGWDEWITLDVVQKIYVRDGITHTPSMREVKEAQARIELEMKKYMSRMRGPIRRQNTRSQRKQLALYTRGPWRGVS